MTRGAARSLLLGLVVAALYAASAVLSGHLSPLARRPLLDGGVPPVPYRWVDPPPELEATNLAPATGRFRLRLTEAGSVVAVFTTDDIQVTLILPEGAFPAAGGQRAVRIVIEPVDPSELEPPGDPWQILGNAYRLEAMYVPSGEEATLVEEARVVLVYPFTTAGHVAHSLVHSRDGERWSEVDTNDLRSIVQADGPIDALGYVAVAGEVSTPGAAPPAEPGGDGWRTVLIVVAAVAAAGAIGLWLHGGRTLRSARDGS